MRGCKGRRNKSREGISESRMMGQAFQGKEGDERVTKEWEGERQKVS